VLSDLSGQKPKCKKIRHWLFIFPIVIGLAFACAGIPSYGMLFSWCNNTAEWWPEIPVIVAITLTTSLYSIMTWDMYKTEQASNAHAFGGGQGNPMSVATFWQSYWYLWPFYLVWLPYVALQFTWASGSGYSNYYFIMAASVLVPLQGFLNAVVYFRKRAKRKLLKVIARLSSWLGPTQHQPNNQH